MSSNNVQATFDRLAQLSGVQAAILVDPKGEPIRSTLNQVDTMKYAHRLTPVVMTARSIVQEMDPTDDLTYLRLRTRKQELMAATENQHTIIIIQDNQTVDESRRTTMAQHHSWSG